jgi:demethoxyubiquinone hydroxylase (CLK1/Coq7/Cat5 family)
MSVSTTAPSSAGLSSNIRIKVMTETCCASGRREVKDGSAVPETSKEERMLRISEVKGYSAAHHLLFDKLVWTHGRRPTEFLQPILTE